VAAIGPYREGVIRETMVSSTISDRAMAALRLPGRFRLADYILFLGLLLAVGGVISVPAQLPRWQRVSWLVVCCQALVVCGFGVAGLLLGRWDLLKDSSPELTAGIVAVSIPLTLIALHRTGTVRFSPREFLSVSVTLGPRLSGAWERQRIHWLVIGSTRLPSKWLGVATDLSTLTLRPSDLENFYLLAKHHARLRLAEDAQIVLRYLVIKGSDPRIEFRGWSARAVTGCAIIIRPNAQPLAAADKDWRRFQPTRPPWQGDDSWLDLLRQAASLEGWDEVNLHPVQPVPEWGHWQLQVSSESIFVADPKYYGLHAGTLQECPPDVRVTDW
jgi:hypothetical protein